MKEQHIDRGLGRHYIILHDPETGAEHHIPLDTSHRPCPCCGHVWPIDNLGQIDLKALLKEEIGNLEKGKAQTDEWGKKHNVPILKADGKAR